MPLSKVVFPLLLCASLQGAARPEAPVERVFYGGKIITGDTRVLWTIVGGKTVSGAQPGSLVAQGIPDTIAQHLVALEQRWNDAILRNDSALAGTFMAEEWTEITTDGSVLSRAGDLAELVGGYHATALRLSDMVVHVYDDAAVVSGISEELSSFRGKDTSGRFRWMDVWVRRAGRWVCVVSTVARIASR